MKYINFGNQLISSDLKRLKKIKSLEEDIESQFKMIRGKIFEINRPELYTNRLGDFILQVCYEDIKILVYKSRFVISDPKSKGTADGYRTVFGILQSDKKTTFIPILVFIANEEGKTITETGKKVKLQSKGLKVIVKKRITNFLG